MKTTVLRVHGKKKVSTFTVQPNQIILDLAQAHLPSMIPVVVIPTVNTSCGGCGIDNCSVSKFDGRAAVSIEGRCVHTPLST